MTTRILGLALVLSASAAPSVAQDEVGLAAYLQLGYAGSKVDLLESAEKMPADAYDFRPSEMSDMRTFSRVMVHAADAQFGICASVRGVPNPKEGQDLEQLVTRKPDVVALLREASDFCDEAFSSLTDDNANSPVAQGRRRIAQSAILAGLLAHNAEMYGISTVYLRAQNIVPPSTERQRQRQANR